LLVAAHPRLQSSPKRELLYTKLDSSGNLLEC
jgi:hypothetical protein